MALSSKSTKRLYIRICSDAYAVLCDFYHQWLKDSLRLVFGHCE